MSLLASLALALVVAALTLLAIALHPAAWHAVFGNDNPDSHGTAERSRGEHDNHGAE